MAASSADRSWTFPSHLSASANPTLRENVRTFSSSTDGSSGEDKTLGDKPRTNTFIRLRPLADQVTSKKFVKRSQTVQSKLKVGQQDLRIAVENLISGLTASSVSRESEEVPSILEASGDLNELDQMESMNEAYEKLLDVYSEGLNAEEIQDVLDFFPTSDLKRQSMQAERIKEQWIRHGVKFGIEAQRLDEIWETIGLYSHSQAVEHGFAVVVDGTTSPPVAYTVGLSGSFGFGFEILVVGSTSESLMGARSIIRQCVAELEEKYALIDVPDSLRLDKLIDGRRVALKEAKDSKLVNEKFARLADLYVRIHNPEKDSENMSKIMQMRTVGSPGTEASAMSRRM
ncbi:hypothetical protein GUITHDRAFT_142264 [Guillardia theta CCMP2712]|uniref:Uncharacterized protein n=1 Tax=Guillardia theta (strain CCMP2712) TaxID=905079 RepID=L1IYB9_GUITC|nr:hypothetical protein GUITHDRAFT_142264 [Guillardia theta CCMP2712]EKX41107.1 hypothetical protein GUITHDRAFT_142264 [Guillardia theta CCMP2712]|eukprot:XP_005828087.1 hypothetical protein GUITHDRAFT_142264 [Guillardia theta CCMP2712]